MKREIALPNRNGSSVTKAEKKILTVRYARWKLVLTTLALSPFIYIMTAALLTAIKRSNVVTTILLAILVVPLWILLVYEWLFDRIEFYETKVVKKYFIIGRREITYKNARIDPPQGYLNWNLPSRHIREVDRTVGIVGRFLPIMYNDLFFRAIDRRKMNILLDYATGRGPRDWKSRFKKTIIHESELPKLFSNLKQW